MSDMTCIADGAEAVLRTVEETWMRAAKQKRLETAGWRVGSVDEFLGLDDVESQYVEIKVSLARLLRSTRMRRRLTQFELAERIGSSQSRVAKLEAGDPSVSVDLLVRSLLAVGAKPGELAKAVSAKRRP
jgi:DNA-binding XRE family transcriptional regulator